jgi:hypothetical protein
MENTKVNNYCTQQQLIITKLLDFYKDECILTNVLHMITGKLKISLRIIDWFVTNYSKQYFIQYPVKNEWVSMQRFKVYDEYQLYLDSYKKMRFDPFCRWKRIYFPYINNTYIETTIGQLNFFRWVIQNNIIQYVNDNYELIEKDMNERNSSSKKGKPKISGRKKREELSISATKSMKKEDVEIVIQFK